MDSDLIWQQFDKIEGKVERLVAVCKSLETANAELTAQVSELKSALEEKEAAENRFEEEKRLIRTKVDHLLSKLEQISEMQT